MQKKKKPQLCILNSCVIKDQTLIKRCSKKNPFSLDHVTFLNLALLDVDYGESRLGAGDAE